MPEQQSIEIPPGVAKRLLDRSELPDIIDVGGRQYRPQRTVDAGKKGVVWKALDENGRPRALKLATYDDYVERSWASEIEYAAPLETYSYFARIDHVGRVSIPMGDVEGDFDAVCFVEEWIEGITLRDFLHNRPEEIDAMFFLDYADNMTRALEALAHHELEHDDLHAGNVMLADPAPGDDGHMKVRVIDMGSLKPKSRVVKDKRDLDRFAEHLIEIYNAIVVSRSASRNDRRFLAEVREVPLKRMLDPDPTVALRDPKEIRRAFHEADSRARHVSQPGGSRPMTSPFEFISSEHISDDRTFVKLFAETPWLSKVASRDPCLVTGPRGCGKSTLFRWLSLRTQLSREQPDLRRFPIAGFYLSCSTELEGRFSWLEDVTAVKEWAKELIHFFNLILAREVLDTLLKMRDRQDEHAHWHIGETEEGRILEFLQDTLGRDIAGISGASRLRLAQALVERERYRCDIAMRRTEHIEHATTETFLADFCRLLVDAIPFFSEHRITFLIDDFTRRRVSENVQRALNEVIWPRRENHLFKVSSEKDGADLNDLSGRRIDSARELITVDIGIEYLSLADGDELRQAHLFATELLDARLRAAKYEGNAIDLLGHSDWGQHGTLARALRDDPKSRSQYHGLECVADLCSGDVATLLLVYRRIFEAAKVTQDTRKVVLKAVQHRAIERLSGEQVEMLHDHHPCGPEMRTVVNEFGTYVANVLRHGKLIKQGQGGVPPTCPRIEVDDNSQVGEKIAGGTRELFNELRRRAVFIEMDPGRSRKDHVQTLRWQLRRIYLPNFGAALTKNVALKLSPADFKLLLDDPTTACRKFWRMAPKADDDGGGGEALTLDDL